MPSGSYTISGHGGTSAAAPTWAAIIALADQYAKRHVGFVNPAIYQIARSSHYHQAFHDITVGNNTAEFSNETITGYRAGPGWDPGHRLGQSERRGTCFPCSLATRAADETTDPY